MRNESPHNETEQNYISLQQEMQTKIDFTNLVDLSTVKTVAGVDLAYWKVDGQEYAACCIVILDFKTKEVIERVHSADKITVPYIPGCLAFREIPLFLTAYDKLSSAPDLLVFDGNGYLHPRHMGLATHAGILINKPTIGVAKSYYKVQEVDFVMPDEEAGSYTDIRINEEVYGRVLRTHTGVRPIFVSVGNRINLETATEAVKEFVTKESHIPMPTRLADLMTHEVRKKYEANEHKILNE